MSNRTAFNYAKLIQIHSDDLSFTTFCLRCSYAAKQHFCCMLRVQKNADKLFVKAGKHKVLPFNCASWRPRQIGNPDELNLSLSELSKSRASAVEYICSCALMFVQ